MLRENKMTDSPKPDEILKWRGKLLAELSDDDLAVVQTTLKNMHEATENIKWSPEYAKKFKGQPVPDINPHFTKLKAAVDKELEDRKKV